VDHCRELLEGKPCALGITPQGAFTSNSARPIRFQPGIGAIAKSLSRFYVSTVVFDYEFWSEKRPEAFLSVRPPERVTVGPDFDRRAFVHDMERKMEDHLDALTALREQRDPTRFSTLVSRSNGISPVYDAGRALVARLHGESFAQSHGDILTPHWREIKHRGP